LNTQKIPLSLHNNKKNNMSKKLSINQIHDKLKAINLLGEANRPVKYSVFKNMATIQKYGKGRNVKKIVFAGKPKENLFGFYVIHDTDPNVMKEAYSIYKLLVNGDREVLEDSSVIWGNSGLPLAYGYIRITNGTVI